MQHFEFKVAYFEILIQWEISNPEGRAFN